MLGSPICLYFLHTVTETFKKMSILQRKLPGEMRVTCKKACLANQEDRWKLSPEASADHSCSAGREGCRRGKHETDSPLDIWQSLLPYVLFPHVVSFKTMAAVLPIHLEDFYFGKMQTVLSPCLWCLFTWLPSIFHLLSLNWLTCSHLSSTGLWNWKISTWTFLSASAHLEEVAKVGTIVELDQGTLVYQKDWEI